MVFRQQQRQHVRESKGVPMRTVRKNFSMMLRYLMWEAPIKTGAVRQDGHIVDTKIPSAILSCFSLRTECRGNELLMLHRPCLLCGLGQDRTQITTRNCSAWAYSWESGSGMWRTRKQKTRSSLQPSGMRNSAWSFLISCQLTLTLTGVTQNTFMTLPTDLPRKRSCKLGSQSQTMFQRFSQLIFWELSNKGS